MTPRRCSIGVSGAVPPRGAIGLGLPRCGLLLRYVVPAGPDEDGHGRQADCSDEGQAVDDPVHAVCPPDSHGVVVCAGLCGGSGGKCWAARVVVRLHQACGGWQCRFFASALRQSHHPGFQTRSSLALGPLPPRPGSPPAGASFPGRTWDRARWTRPASGSTGAQQHTDDLGWCGRSSRLYQPQLSDSRIAV